MNKNAILTSQLLPRNYDLFSLHKILSISTGVYTTINNDVIDTTQWESLSSKYVLSSDTDSLHTHSDEGKQEEEKSIRSSLHSSESFQESFSVDDNNTTITKTSMLLREDMTKQVVFKQVVIAGQKGLYDVIAMLCSNGVIILRFMGSVKSLDREGSDEGVEEDTQLSSPLIRCVNYFREKKKSVSCIALEPSGRFLACCTTDREVYVIPVCRQFFPQNEENVWPFRKRSSVIVRHQFPTLREYISKKDTEKAGIEFLETLKEISVANTKPIRPGKKHVDLLCCSWWRSFNGEQHLIIGTENGRLVFFNLQTRTEECVTKSNKLTQQIKNIEIIEDPQKQFKFAFITAAHGNFYTVLLEQMDTEFHTYKTLVQDYHENYGSKHFLPVQAERFCKEYPCKVTVRTLPKKGPLLCSFSKLNQQLSVYDPSSHRFPLFVYQLNQEAALVHFTNSLLFSVQRPTSSDILSNSERIWVISKILASTGPNSVNSIWKKSKAKNPSVFQEFVLPTGQRILGMLQGYKTGEFVDEGLGDAESTFIWSQNTLYELRIKNAPGKIFKHLVNTDNTQDADMIGKTFSLNMFELYEKCADEEFEKQNYDLAFKLYKLSNVSETKFVQRLMQTKQVDTVLEYLTNIMKYPSKLSTSKKKELANLLFTSYMYKITTHRPKHTDNSQYKPPPQKPRAQVQSLRKTLSKTFEQELSQEYLSKGLGTLFYAEHPVDPNLWEKFRTFLIDCNDYNAETVLKFLIDRGFISLSIEVAHKTKSMENVLQTLVEKGFINLKEHIIQFLYQYDYADLMLRVGGGVLLSACAPKLQVLFLLSYLKRTLKDKKLQMFSVPSSIVVNRLLQLTPYLSDEETLVCFEWI